MDNFNEYINSKKSYRITKEGMQAISKLLRKGAPIDERNRALDPAKCYYLHVAFVDICEHPELCTYLEEIDHDVERELDIRDKLMDHK